MGKQPWEGKLLNVYNRGSHREVLICNTKNWPLPWNNPIELNPRSCSSRGCVCTRQVHVALELSFLIWIRRRKVSLNTYLLENICKSYSVTLVLHAYRAYSNGGWRKLFFHQESTTYLFKILLQNWQIISHFSLTSGWARD